MSDEWNHPMCERCWWWRMARQPVAVELGEERCCFCGQKTSAGIYVREDPEVPVYHLHHR